MISGCGADSSVAASSSEGRSSTGVAILASPSTSIFCSSGVRHFGQLFCSLTT